ncbi:hypothetical protein LWI29_038072 [Acer saccharum]|uniref:HMA domain-containing protein n=1 Tax=Acer saccharum TaxID=4024 RepID=A0AA39RJV4_ACESA|nr:hypothetical protein LWI29_038072 [Acer saccharum]KAK1552857.1 hypothetical protein Q3G72_024564 [Acer saccharum]
MGSKRISKSAVVHHVFPVRIIDLRFREGENMMEVEQNIRNSSFDPYISSLTINQQTKMVTVKGEIDSYSLVTSLRKTFIHCSLVGDRKDDEELTAGEE